MIEFDSEEELSSYLSDFYKDYGSLYGKKLWDADIRSSSQLANAPDSALALYVSNPFHASDIKARAASAPSGEILDMRKAFLA